MNELHSDRFFQKQSPEQEAIQQKILFFCFCSEHDQDMLLGKKNMPLTDFARLLYLISTLGFLDYCIELLDCFSDLASDYLNQELLETEIAMRYQWANDFIAQLPTDRIRTYLSQLFVELD